MNEKTTTITFIFCLLTAGLTAQNPTLQWVTAQDGMGLEIPHDIKPSSDGNVFLFNDFASSAQESSYDPDGEINKGSPKLQIIIITILRTVPEPQRKPLPVHLI